MSAPARPTTAAAAAVTAMKAADLPRLYDDVTGSMTKKFRDP